MNEIADYLKLRRLIKLQSLLAVHLKLICKFVKKSMSKYKFVFIILGFFALGSGATSQNLVVIDTTINREILLGIVNKEGLSLPVFVENWEEAYNSYQPDAATVNLLKKYLRKNKNVTIQVFFGSWCGDSQDQLPNFVKLQDQAKIKRVEYFALNRKKYMPKMDTSFYRIKYVPTFIVYRDGKEAGRIVETPNESLEKDLWNILNAKKEE